MIRLVIISDVTIGPCMGCARMARLDDRVCSSCLGAPDRGRRWAELADHCRRDPAFAAAVYERIESPRGRQLFLALFAGART